MDAIVRANDPGQALPRDVPVLRGAPVIGALLPIRKDPLNFFVNIRRALGDVVKVKVGTDQILFVADPEIIEHVLETNHRNYVKSRYLKRMATIFGSNVIIADGEDWRRRRKFLRPAFTRAHIEELGWLVVGEVTAMIERWRLASRQGQPINALDEFMDLTLGVIVKSLLGVDVGARGSIIARALAVMLATSERRLWTPINVPSSVPIPSNLALKRAIAQLDQAVYSIIGERRKSGDGRNDILSALLSAEGDPDDPISDVDIRDEIVGMIVAGHETTATTLTWAVEALSRHPNIDRRLRAEVQEVLQGRTPTIGDAADLKYCRMVLQETMRLRPPVWTVSREALADDQVKGVRIAAGTVVMMSPFVVHRHDGYWPNPEGFDPERFVDGEPAGAAKYAYFPFAGGPRRCVGKHFSMTEMLIALPMLIQNFQLSLIPGHPVEMQPMITLRPRHGLWMLVSDAAAATRQRAA